METARGESPADRTEWTFARAASAPLSAKRATAPIATSGEQLGLMLSKQIGRVNSAGPQARGGRTDPFTASARPARPVAGRTDLPRGMLVLPTPAGGPTKQGTNATPLPLNLDGRPRLARLHGRYDQIAARTPVGRLHDLAERTDRDDDRGPDGIGRERRNRFKPA